MSEEKNGSESESESDDQTEFQNLTCFFCGISASDEVSLQKCEHCNLVWYCGLRHEKLHRPKNTCYPVKVARHPTKGTYLVATRDIKPLEVIVDQYPVIHGPYAKPPQPQCLECFKILEEEKGSDPNGNETSRFYRCTKCNYPMCGEKCEKGEIHSNFECLAFQQGGYQVDTQQANDSIEKLLGVTERGNGEIFKDIKSYRQHIEGGGFSPYCFISTIRCMLMKDDWADVTELRDHNKERHDFDPEAWEEHETKVGIFLLEVLKLKGCSLEDIYHSIGVLSINNANLAMGEGHGKGAGLYVTYSRVNHGCTCNTKTLKYKDNRLELRASEDIKSGHEVVNQYVKPNSGTVSRRLVLKNKWHFECDCKRCRDPTEFGSLLSALTCSKCSDAVLPEHPTDVKADWKCIYCGSSYSIEYVSEALLNAETALKNSDAKEDIIQHYERFIYEQSKTLHPNNYILINAKMKLGLLYGNYKPYLLSTMSRPNIDRKIQVCQEVLDVLGRVDSGYTSWRTNTLNEVTKAKGLLARRAFKEGKLSQDELKNIIASEKMLKCYIAYHQRLFFGDRSDKDMWLV